ncbi:type IV pilin protein [Cupriavidus sp. SW-Y-13]|uniref:type IV pilin protein n=1 Tax=Cupriavidus sp. SW-Y-13 TaxID=2653854 RepID=UPI001F1E0896|nr:prepilin-type N-terminal cleavage/methylation domain-containing protein [Cupriavidus sp. SW-Y-13]
MNAMNAMNEPHRTQRCAGFSLIELLVVVVIAALLTVLALPAWQRHAERAWRLQARASLISAMLTLERHALITTSFAKGADGANPAGDWPSPVPAPPARTRHWLTATSCAGADLSHCVEIRATPTYPDASCGIVILRSNGEWLSMLTTDDIPIPLPEAC